MGRRRLFPTLPEVRRLRARVTEAYVRAGGSPALLHSLRVMVNAGASAVGVVVVVLSLALGISLRIPVASGLIGFTMAMIGVLGCVLGGLMVHRLLLERVLRRVEGQALSSVGGTTSVALPAAPRMQTDD